MRRNMRRKGRLGSLIVTCYTWTSRIFPVDEWQFFTPKQVITQDGEEDLNFYDIFVAFVKERILLSLTALNINNKRKRQLPNIGDQDR